MAKVKFYKNLFENDCDIIDVAVGSKVEDLINKYLPDNPYASDLVECYDPEEDKTYYVSLTDDKEPSVAITVNEQIISPDYIVQENDLINVVYMPASKGDGWWIGLIAGVAVGVVAAVASGLILGVAGSALAIMGAWGGAIGGVAGAMIGSAVDNRADVSMESYSEGAKELEKNPAIRGASNQALLGNTYPFVIGKHLITPFVIGSPITSYEGVYGKDARISLLLCAGYGPLKLTDFKLDETFLSYNGGTKNPTGKGTLLRGTLSGDDILDLWNENDVKIEILQLKSGDQPWRGSIYPTVKIDKEINANCLFIADKTLQDQAGVVYKGATFPTNFRTNNVYFTESCPKSVTINFVANSGLFKSFSRTESSEKTSFTKTVYERIPVWYAVQYRYYNDNNKPSDPMGNDYNSWTTIQCNAMATNYGGEIVNVALNKTFTPALAQEDKEAHTGNDLSDLSSTYGNWSNNCNLVNFGELSGERGNRQIRIPVTFDLSNTASKCFEEGNSIKGVEIRVIRVSPSYLNEKSTTSSSESDINDGPDSFSDTVGIESIVTEVFDEELYKNTGTVKPVYAVPTDRDLHKFCYIAISAKADTNGYITKALQKISCTAEAFSPQWDSKNKKWLPEGVQSRSYYPGYFNPAETDYVKLSDPNYRLAHEADRTNVSDNSYEVALTYPDPALSDEERERLSMCELGKARRDGYNWLPRKGGSNFAETIKSMILYGSTTINNCENCYLKDEYKFYNGNSSASAAMLVLVGPQSGLAGVGYENINLTSFGEWAEDCIGVKDGSTKKDGSLLSVDMKANGYVCRSSKLESLLAQIVTTGRAIYTYDTNGKIKVIMDKPSDYPVGVLSDQNCESSQNTYSYDELPAGLSITFSDENDGYENNSLFCWADGNSYSNYRGQVVPYSIPFVTNPAQSWSLGRYFLANRLLNRSVLTRKTGPEGCTYELGDVVVVQSSNLLIGESSSARIQQIIKDDKKVYGVVTDAVYTYDEKTPMGITILQPKKYSNSKVVTLELAPVGRAIIVDNVTYVQDKGLLNFALFNTPIEFSDDSHSTVEQQYNFSVSDVCMFGEIKHASEKYRIIKIKQESPTSYTQTLLKYDEAVYKYGAELPSFQSYRRIPNVSKDPAELSEVPKDLVELNDANQSNNNIIQQQINRLYSNHVITLYKRSKTPLAQSGILSDAIYNFSNNTFKFIIEAQSNGWKQDANATDPSEGVLYSITATAFGRDVEDIITFSEWSYPIQVTGEPGKDGVAGLVVFLEKSALVYQADSLGNVKEEKTSSKVVIQQAGVNLPFFIGEIEVPQGFEIYTRGAYVFIKALEGDKMLNNGFIKIPINYHPLKKDWLYQDGKDRTYSNEDPQRVYGQVEMSDEERNVNLYISYAKAVKGNSVESVIEYYVVTDSGEIPPTAEADWVVNKIPPYTSDKKFLWNKEETFFADDTLAAATAPALIGNYSEDGRGIVKITNYYQVTSVKIPPSIEGFDPTTPGDWNTDPKQTLTDDKNKYLWNFEYIEFTKGNPKITEPALIGTHGQRGITGRSVTSVINLYLKTTKEKDVTKEDEGWVENPEIVPIPDRDVRYVWAYEKTLDEDDILITETNPIRIASFAEDGRGVKSIIDEYALSNDKLTPPTDFQEYEEAPVPDETKPYLWNREKITYTKGNPLTETTQPRIIGMYGAKGEQGMQGPYYWGVNDTNPSDDPKRPLVVGCWYLNSKNGNIYILSSLPSNWEPLYTLYEEIDYNDTRVQACINDMIALSKNNTSLNNKFQGMTSIYANNLVSGTILTEALFAKKIKIGKDGAIIGGDRYNENGDLVGTEVPYLNPGFFLGTNGVIKGNLQDDEFANIIIGKDAVKNVKYSNTSEGRASISNNVVIGRYAGTEAHSFYNNVILGDSCAKKANICANNVFIGASMDQSYRSFDSVVIGNDNNPSYHGFSNICVGHQNTVMEETSISQAVTENNIIIGNSILQDAREKNNPPYGYKVLPPSDNIIIGNFIGYKFYRDYDDYGDYITSIGIKGTNQILIGNMRDPATVDTSKEGWQDEYDWIRSSYINIGNRIVYNGSYVELPGVFYLEGTVLHISFKEGI